MASFAIHCFPTVITLALRWHIIPGEEMLPPEERMFCTITKHDQFDGFFWHTMIVNNLKFYIAWAVPYSIINFIMFGETIKKGGYFTLYGYFWTIGWSAKGFTYLGPYFAPIGFMFHHFLFYFFANVLGIISFYYSYFGHAIAFIFITVTVQRGAHLYVKGIS